MQQDLQSWIGGFICVLHLSVVCIVPARQVWTIIQEMQNVGVTGTKHDRKWMKLVGGWNGSGLKFI